MRINEVAAYGVVGLIRIYQKTISPDHGVLRFVFPQGVCRYRPTCSQYMVEAIRKYGVFRGVGLGLKRLGRCHPWGGSGEDKP